MADASHRMGRPRLVSPGRELCMGATYGQGARTGLWIYALDRSEPVKILDGPIALSSWASNGTNLVFDLALSGHAEVWLADVDPNFSAIEALGPGRTLDEHLREMVVCDTRRIAADPQDAYAYFSRAQYYDYLHNRAKANADMRRWSAVMSGRSPSDLEFDTPRAIRRVINGPFDCQFVFSAERLVNEIPVLNVALGQKGRCSMKSFQIPMLSTRGLFMSLLGLCLLSGLETPPVYADFVFGTPTYIGGGRYIPQRDGRWPAAFCRFRLGRRSWGLGHLRFDEANYPRPMGFAGQSWSQSRANGQQLLR